MKNNIKAITLSYIHIGSGVMLSKGNDFVVIDGEEGSDIYVIDANKFGAIIGSDLASINQWVDHIKRGTASEFIRNRTQGHSPMEYSKRRIINFADFRNTQGTLKECLHDGMGRPYIPGSSIKGAIRTAVLASLARKKGREVLNNEFRRIFQEENKSKRKRMLSSIEQSFFGNNPNSDIFRFVTVGDAYFDKNSEIAVKQVNLNIRNRNSLKDSSKQQIIEAIGDGEMSSFSLKIDKNRFEQVKNVHHEYLASMPPFPDELADIPRLFSLINQHTKQLTEDEINMWEKDYNDFDGQDDYVNYMKDILNDIIKCKPNECVIRLGQAIGWRFITGAWTELIDEEIFYENIVPIARPHDREKYSEYVFPKSRRIDDESFIFGFLKLSLEEQT